MRRILALSLVLFAVAAHAQDRKTREADLGKKGTTAIDNSLAGDLKRKKSPDQGNAPALDYDKFRVGVELQVASIRHEQIESLKKILDITPPNAPDRAGLLFRLGELYWEESKFHFFEANRKDDDYIRAMNAKDQAGMERAKAEKEDLINKSKEFAKIAMDQYSEIVQRHKDYDRTDEVLYFLGHNLMEQGEDRKSLVAYKRLVDKYPKSKFLPDAYLAFGEYYFNNSKGKRDMLEKALENYKKAAGFPDNQVYAFALYKQGWCYFNMADYQKAMDMFKAVVLYGELAGDKGVEKDGGKSGKSTLIKEARNDFVRAYAQFGSPADARAEFGKLTGDKLEDRYLMVKQLANLYYEDGKDKEAALTFNMLIKEKPLSPEAPGFQGKIVDCILRAGNKRMTVEQVRKLVKVMQEVEKSGVVKTDKDKQALAEAKDLSERTLSNLAVTWHKEAQKTRDEDTFQLANEVYSDYLTLFSDNPKSYDMRFFWAELLNDNLQKFDKAAEEYTKVVLYDAQRIEKKLPGGEKDKDGNPKPGTPGKWLVNASYNAVLAYDEVVKAAEGAGQLKVDTTDSSKKVAIPGPKKALLDACERYLKYVPKGEKRVEIAFKAANIYYRYNHFDEAVFRFSDIALSYPDYKFENGERAAEIAANLVLDSYNLLGNWAKVNEWARKFYQSDKLATGKFREDLSKVIEQSSFKLVNQLEAKKEFAKAAEAYLNFVNEFPKSEIADKALFNASIDFFNAKMLDKAVETRKHIIAKYPKSEHVPACMYANAEALEAVGDFEEAAVAYEAYVRGFEKTLDKSELAHKGKKSAKAKPGKGKKEADAPAKPEVVQTWDKAKAQVALFNAGVFREGLGQYRQALKDREHYLELWPEASDAEAVFLSIVDLHEKMSAYGKAINMLLEYEKKYVREPAKVLMAEGRIANIQEQKMRRPKDAEKTYARLLKYFEQQPKRIQSNLDNAALDAVARAHFLSNEDEFQKFKAVRLKWGKLPHPEKDFKASLTEKLTRLKEVQKLYTRTVELKSADPAICALHRIGLAYDHLVETLVNAPMPRGAPDELKDAIRDEMSNQANPLRDKAAEAFMLAAQKSHELDVLNDCALKSLKMLQETYRPDQFPTMQEETAELKDVKVMIGGGDLLAAVQPIPVLTVAQQAEAKEKVEAVKEDLAALKDRPAEPPPNAEPAEPPPNRNEPARGAGSESTGGGTSKSGSEEPEDNL